MFRFLFVYLDFYLFILFSHLTRSQLSAQKHKQKQIESRELGQLARKSWFIIGLKNFCIIGGFEKKFYIVSSGGLLFW